MKPVMIMSEPQNSFVAVCFLVLGLFQSCTNTLGIREKGISTRNDPTENRASQVDVDITAKVMPGRESDWVMRKALSKRDVYVKAFHFLTSEVGWAISNRSIFKTINGGKTWEMTKLNFINSSEIKSLHFLDDYNGWLLLQDGGDDYSKLSKVSVFRTTDGGAQWSLEHVEDSSVINEAFFDVTQTWLIGMKFVRDYPRTLAPLIIRHLNGTHKWEDVTARSNGVSKLIEKPSQLASDHNGCLLLADKVGTIVKSCDSGNSWERLTSTDNFPADSSYRVLSIEATNDFIWTLESAGGMGGLNSVLTIIPYASQHNRVTVSLPRLYLRSGIAISDSEFYLVGKGSESDDGTMQLGTILQTVDGGKTWRHIFSTISQISVAQFFLLTSQIWLLTTDGELIALEQAPGTILERD